MQRRARAPTSPVTMNEVAEAAGVSMMTVSNTFKHPERVQPQTRELIEKAAKRLGYVPNLIAGHLASGRSRTVAAIVPSIQNANFARQIQGLGDTLAAGGYELLLAIADTPEREAAVVRNVLGRRPDGLVLTGSEHEPGLPKLIATSRVPAVETWGLGAPPIDMAVGFKVHDAAYEITALLIERGYRKIGFAGHDIPVSLRFSERERGFRSALRDRGLDDRLIVHAPISTGFSGGGVALNLLLEREPGLQALLGVTDVVAVGALFECQRRGWAVPGRMAVAGYGDFEIAKEVPPGLTTVRTRGWEVGEAAARMLLQKIETGRAPAKSRDVGYEVIERGST
jgi:LacI family gluconate utilization system Gnt-I transcriptional repressor